MAAAEVQPTVDSARQPKETLYCHNLNEKLKKEGTQGETATCTWHNQYIVRLGLADRVSAQILRSAYMLSSPSSGAYWTLSH